MVLKVSIFVLLWASSTFVWAQSITATNDQGLGFGDFTQTADPGGTITISNTGVRSATGNVVLLGSTYFYAIFSITTDSATPVTVTIDQPTATLSGSNGGTMSLQIGIADPQSPSVSQMAPAEVHIGGTITLGTRLENPPGSYSGNVLITFTVNNQ